MIKRETYELLKNIAVVYYDQFVEIAYQSFNNCPNSTSYLKHQIICSNKVQAKRL
jgi:hypothetical protein